MLHNETYLRDDRLTSPEVYVVCRQTSEHLLLEFGTIEEIAQSKHTRFEHSSRERYTLYLLRFHPHLAKMPANVRMTPLQATGRDVGPFLGKSVAQTTENSK